MASAADGSMATARERAAGAPWRRGWIRAGIGGLLAAVTACARLPLAPPPTPASAALLEQYREWEDGRYRRVVGVPPFIPVGPDPTLGDLSYALADLLMTDLSRSRQLRLVERARLGEVLRELDLARTGRVDSASAPRAGRLLQAGRLVLGTLGPLNDGQGIRIGARIEEVVEGTVRTAVDAQAPLADILAAEKALAFRLLESMGVRLTPAEQAAIEARPTANVQALLAYGRGARREYLGEYAAARREYRAARVLDPRFQLARQREQDMRAMQEAGTLDAELAPGLHPLGTTVGIAIDRINRPLPLTSLVVRTFGSPADPAFPVTRGTVLISVVRP
jgi:hypothetical protein